MNKTKWTACILTAVLSVSAFAGCKQESSTRCVAYTDGMSYTETKKGDVVAYSALSYDIIGGDEVMPIGGFYAPFTSGGSLDGHTLPDFITDEYYQKIADCGINLFVYSIDRWTSGGDVYNPNLVKALDLCEKYHIGYFVDAWWTRNQLGTQTQDFPLEDMTMTSGGENAELKALVDEISANGNREAFVGMLSFDEPFTAQLDNLGVFSDAFYGLDNTQGYDLYLNARGYWAGVDNFWGYSDPMAFDDYIRDFFEIVKPRMLSVTQYPFTSAQTPDSNITALLTNQLQVAREYSKEYGVPFWRMMQAGGQWNDAGAWIETVSPYPSEGEMLFDVNISLAYGAKAIQYFPLIQPQYYANQTGGTYDFENRNGLIGADGNLTRWYYYAQRANKQVQAIDHVLMKASNEGVIVHGEDATKVIVTNGEKRNTIIENGKFRQLKSVEGDDCIVGCFDYKGGTALYAVNYSRTEKADITLRFDESDYLYEVIQRATSNKFVGNAIPLRLDAGEGALIVLA